MPTRWPRSWLRPEVPDRRGREPQLKRRLGDALDHEQPRYVDRDGVHCCGPCDCRRKHATKLRETQAGIATTTGAGDIILMPRARVAQGLDPSIDYNCRHCIRGGMVRCVFKPLTGR